MKQESKIKIAREYALALLESVGNDKGMQKIIDDLFKIKDLIKNSDFIKDLANPIWSDKEKKETVKEIAQKIKLSKEMLNCLNLIIDYNRIREIPDILREFKQLYYAQKGIVEVNVETVQDLTKTQDKKLKENLQKRLNKEVVIEYKINPSILGGLTIEYGSNLIDNSINGKLNRIEKAMKGEL